MVNGASATRPLLLISASVVSPTVQTGTVLTRGWKGIGQVSIGELRILLPLLTSLVKSSTQGDMVGGGFLKSESPGSVLRAADNALRSRSS